MDEGLAVDPLVFLDGSGVRLVSEYFASGERGLLYAGAMFERFAGGGARPEVANRFTTDDIVAVTMLSVNVPPRATLWILDEGASETGELLAEIRTDIDLADADSDTIDDESPAGHLWEVLRKRHGLGPTTVGKLLARKRPRLLPVYDDVVRAALGLRGNYWKRLHTSLRKDDGALARRLAEVRSGAGVGDDISLLRILDIAIWMRNQGKRWAGNRELKELRDIKPAAG